MQLGQVSSNNPYPMQSFTNACSEERLILECCQKIIQNQTSRPFAVDVNKLDPQKVVAISHHHRLELIVNYCLNAPEEGLPSSPLSKMLLRKSTRLTLRQLNLQKALLLVHKALAREAITHVFLKGACLNHQLFNNRTLRYSKDIDLLVKRADFLRVDNLLRKNGFHCKTPSKEVMWHVRMNTKQDFNYFSTSTNVLVEAHWKTDYLDVFNSSELGGWASKIQTIELYSHQIPVLSNHYNVLYLCFHASKHAWNRLIWLLDIINFIEKFKIDVCGLLKASEQQNLENMVYEMIALAKYYFEIELIQEPSAKQTIGIDNALKRYIKRYQLMNKQARFDKGAGLHKLIYFYYKTYTKPDFFLSVMPPIKTGPPSFLFKD